MPAQLDAAMAEVKMSVSDAEDISGSLGERDRVSQVLHARDAKLSSIAASSSCCPIADAHLAPVLTPSPIRSH